MNIWICEEAYFHQPLWIKHSRWYRHLFWAQPYCVGWLWLVSFCGTIKNPPEIYHRIDVFICWMTKIFLLNFSFTKYYLFIIFYDFCLYFFRNYFCYVYSLPFISYLDQLLWSKSPLIKLLIFFPGFNFTTIDCA